MSTSSRWAGRATELAESAIAGDRRALARLLTAVENRSPLAEVALRRLYPLAGRAHLVGITRPRRRARLHDHGGGGGPGRIGLRPGADRDGRDRAERGGGRCCG